MRIVKLLAFAVLAALPTAAMACPDHDNRFFAFAGLIRSHNTALDDARRSQADSGTDVAARSEDVGGSQDASVKSRAGDHGFGGDGSDGRLGTDSSFYGTSEDRASDQEVSASPEGDPSEARDWAVFR